MQTLSFRRVVSQYSLQVTAIWENQRTILLQKWAESEAQHAKERSALLAEIQHIESFLQDERIAFIHELRTLLDEKIKLQTRVDEMAKAEGDSRAATEQQKKMQDSAAEEKIKLEKELQEKLEEVKRISERLKLHESVSRTLSNNEQSSS